MKAQLVKREDHWALYNEDGHKIASTLDGCKSKLSVKNCEAIENGYDLDELSKNHAEEIYVRNEYDYNELANFENRKYNFEEGFQKALEILGDKKFSEEDVKRAMDVTLNYETKRDAESYQEKIDFLKSLKQTEWDVEVIMKSENMRYDGGKQIEYDIVPKLDKNGNLILKRL